MSSFQLSLVSTNADRFYKAAFMGVDMYLRLNNIINKMSAVSRVGEKKIQ
jgi:hypothetical protein